MADWAYGLAELVTARIDEPVGVVGHSLGTILGLERWRRRPDRIRAMVFVGGVPRVRDEVRTRLEARLESVAASGLAGWGPNVSPGVFGRRAFETTPEVVGMFERLLETHPPSTYIRNVRALLAASAVDVVPTLSAPCLSITGREDLYAPPASVSEFVQALPRPCDQVVLDGVGHMPFFEVPDEFARVLREFLNRVDRAG
jgi:pimeloyl-ACP methyl ester carboxylesterase